MVHRPSKLLEFAIDIVVSLTIGFDVGEENNEKYEIRAFFKRAIMTFHIKIVSNTFFSKSNPKNP